MAFSRIEKLGLKFFPPRNSRSLDGEGGGRFGILIEEIMHFCHPELVSGSKYLSMELKMYYVYIITNFTNTTLYIGVTNDLARRIYEHKNKFIKGFSSTYNLNKLVFYEETSDINSALAREKQLKNWHRDWKINLIKDKNPEFRDLSEDF